jgi:hypothetical protein
MATEKMLTLRLMEGEDAQIIAWVRSIKRGNRADQLRKALLAYIRDTQVVVTQGKRVIAVNGKAV